MKSQQEHQEEAQVPVLTEADLLAHKRRKMLEDDIIMKNRQMLIEAVKQEKSVEGMTEKDCAHKFGCSTAFVSKIWNPTDKNHVNPEAVHAGRPRFLHHRTEDLLAELVDKEFHKGKRYASKYWRDAARLLYVAQCHDDGVPVPHNVQHMFGAGWWNCFRKQVLEVRGFTEKQEIASKALEEEEKELEKFEEEHAEIYYFRPRYIQAGRHGIVNKEGVWTPGILIVDKVMEMFHELATHHVEGMSSAKPKAIHVEEPSSSPAEAPQEAEVDENYKPQLNEFWVKVLRSHFPHMEEHEFERIKRNFRDSIVRDFQNEEQQQKNSNVPVVQPQDSNNKKMKMSPVAASSN